MDHISDIRAVAIDLDGTTLRSDGTMGEFTQNTLKLCRDKEIQVILCTGRSPAAAEPFRYLLNITGPMVYYNGAAVIDMPNGTLRAGSLVPPDIIQGCVDIALQRDIHFHSFLPGDWLVYQKERAETALYESRTGLRGRVVDMKALFGYGDGKQTGAIKGMFIADPAILDEVEKELDNRFDGRIYRARSHNNYLEVMAAGVSKGQGLSVALQLRGIPSEAAIAFGDAENDLPMADVVSHFYAPANAIEPVRMRSYAVVESNDDEGPARFLWKLLEE
ncbi:MAG: HAD family hydrolase [Treponema sp.]|nr:HAD family hydrolase [Treponema sp.]